MQRAILIDSIKREVKIIDLDSFSTDRLQALYKAIGCDTVTGVAHIGSHGDYMYADDEGLFRTPHTEGDPENNIRGFICEAWYPGPIVGRAVICGPEEMEDAENDTVSYAGVSEWMVTNLYHQANKGNIKWVLMDTDKQSYRTV